MLQAQRAYLADKKRQAEKENAEATAGELIVDNSLALGRLAQEMLINQELLLHVRTHSFELRALVHEKLEKVERALEGPTKEKLNEELRKDRERTQEVLLRFAHSEISRAFNSWADMSEALRVERLTILAVVG